MGRESVYGAQSLIEVRGHVCVDISGVCLRGIG
jgi:hypothetical protein